MATSRIAPTINPIATERKSFTNMMEASLKKGTAAAYHELTGHHTSALCPVYDINASADRCFHCRVQFAGR
ncbi:hypothetical protein E3158_03020 [Escherichia coli O55:H7]|nr:hypothetical protein E3158_03020 [Escherichia coli O55:H7]